MRYCCCGLQGLGVVVGGSGAALLNFGVWFLIAVFMVLIVAGLRLADCGLIVVWVTGVLFSLCWVCDCGWV